MKKMWELSFQVNKYELKLSPQNILKQNINTLALIIIFLSKYSENFFIQLERHLDQNLKRSIDLTAMNQDRFNRSSHH